MGNCSSQKNTVKSRGVKGAENPPKGNEANSNANGTNKNAANVNQDKNTVNQNQQAKKIRNFDIKFYAIDDSYSPNSDNSERRSNKNENTNPENFVFSKTFQGDVTLKECVNTVLHEPSNNFRFHTLIKYNEIELNDKLSMKLDELIKEENEQNSYEIKLIYKGLKNLPKKINEHIASSTDYYATINFHNDNNKELVLFKKNLSEKKGVSLFKIYEDLFDAETNENINEHTSYCNGANNFYVSGIGAKGVSKIFYKIALNPSDLNACKIQYLSDMPNDLQLHSMIYVPDNYIFVTGGQTNEENATTKVYYYDIKNNTWALHSNMQRSRVENSLCLVNDEYLYSVFGNKNDKTNDEKTIERINLRSGERKWELINLETFDLNFFTLYSLVQYKNCLLCIANDENKDTAKLEDNNERNLIINLDDKKISLYSENNIKLLNERKPLPQITSSKLANESDMAFRLDFFERSFIPISDNIMILSPYNHSKDNVNLVILRDGLSMNEAFSLPNEEN
jgi:hypothetical protein